MNRPLAIHGATILLARHAAAERIDARDRVILPGFANTHTHLPRVLARGIYEDLSPPHTPPFAGGLAPLPLPALSDDEERLAAPRGRRTSNAMRVRWPIPASGSCCVNAHGIARARRSASASRARSSRTRRWRRAAWPGSESCTRAGMSVPTVA